MTFTKETIADLTPEEFGARYEAFKLLVASELETVKGLAEDEVHNPKTDIDFWERNYRISDCIYGCDMDDTIEYINNFKAEIAEYEHKRGFRVENKDEIEGDYEDSYAEIGYVGFEASWLEPKEEIGEGLINNEFREFAKAWLAPEGLSGWEINYIDCKLLTLFKDGKLDWNTLRTLVYSDCEV